MSPQSAAVGLSAFLLFSLELIAAKLLLPVFGGCAYVWTGAQVFFQGALLLGYVAAGAAGRKLSRPWALLPYAAGLACFPIALRAAPAGHPMTALLACLARSAGLPALALSMTTPLVQGGLEADGRDHYALFAASNAGALGALLGYPLLIEPHLGVRAQLWAWQAGYAALLALLSRQLWRDRARPRIEADVAARTDWRDAALWLALSAGPSAAMLAVTNLLTLDFAAVPLLWVLPLSLYLLTLIFNFKKEPWYPKRLSLATVFALAAWVAVVLVTALFSADLPSGWHVLRRLWVVNKLFFYCAALFLLCLITHRALARSRPVGRSHLFYVSSAAGGWLGGILIGIVMPLAARRTAMPELDWAVAGTLCIAAFALSGAKGDAKGDASGGALAALGALGLAGFAFYVSRSPAFAPGRRTALRNFYGFYRVADEGGLRRFYHGNTLHGLEFDDPARVGEPLLYFHRQSPLGEVFSLYGQGARRIGVLGLGVGTMAAYGRSGQRFDFYELDPDVESIARADFHYLSRSAAAVRVEIGDARLTLARAQDARYDLLIVDVFSGGAIPVHLLTRQALELYRDRLSPGGLVVLHITNRFLDLGPVVAAEARELGFPAAARRANLANASDELRSYGFWAVLSSRPERLAPLRSRGWDDLAAAPPTRPWTDDYASLWAALGP